MNTFLIFITVGLLIWRIKKTPSMLSKKIYYKELQESIDKADRNLSFFNQELSNKVFDISVWIVITMYGLMGVYYVLVGTYINILMFSILTLMQLVSLVINCSKLKLSIKIEDYMFHRWVFMFNVILDYIYYPLAIYLLI